MKVSVWDTYVQKEDGKTMHFDILVPSNVEDKQTVFSYGADYLKFKSITSSKLTTDECRFCHIEEATKEMADVLNKKGYLIIEMENCN